jgi:hypothetical protein
MCFVAGCRWEPFCSSFLVLLLFGALPTWPYSSRWAITRPAVSAVIVVIVLILV